VLISHRTSFTLVEFLVVVSSLIFIPFVSALLYVSQFVTFEGVWICTAPLMRQLQLRFDFDSTAVRLLIKGH